MKIIVEFVRAEQHWDPDTGEQTNFLVFEFGGKTHQIPCEEADIIAAVRESKGVPAVGVPERELDGLEQHAAALSRVEDYAEPYDEPTVQQQRQIIDDATPEQDELEREFGGDDIPVHSPFAIAEPEELPDRYGDPRPKPPLSSEAQRKQIIAETLASRPRSRDKLAQEKLARLRQAAAAPLRPRVEVDEAGNPIVRAKAIPRTVSVAQATVEKKVGGVRDLGDLVSDDDAFGQG